MSAITFPREGWTTLLDAMIAGLVPWVRLYVNDPTLGDDTVRDDLVELVADWYAPVRATRWTPAALRAGRAFAVVDPAIFRYPGDDPGPEIRGYYVTAGETGPLLWAWRRPGPPFAFGPANRLLTIMIEFRYKPSAEA